MKRLVMTLLLVSGSAAIAQAPPGEEPVAGAEVGDQVLPCVSATDAPQAPADASGPLENQQKDAGQTSVPCEEQDPEAMPDAEQQSAAASGGTGAGPEAIGEDDFDVEASADGEFKPGDEISEDYPVPLPSDI
jgi:hypothetical protein